MNPKKIKITDKELLKISGDIKVPKSVNLKEILMGQLVKKYVHRQKK